jgi:hypothetical protein
MLQSQEKQEKNKNMVNILIRHPNFQTARRAR